MFPSARRRPSALPALFTGALALAVVDAAAAPRGEPVTLADRQHAQAVESFRIGRYPEAYGRFVALADAGHGAAARKALWMCLYGPTLFGRDWDCSPQQVEAWAATPDAQVPRPPTYAGIASGATAARPQRR
jgi:hypothetical protein